MLFFVYEMFMHIQMQGYTNSEIHNINAYPTSD